MNASDPRPRTHPTQIWSECLNLWSPPLKAKASARTRGSKRGGMHERNEQQDRKSKRRRKTSAAAPAIAAQIRHTMRNACSRSAMPASGAEISRNRHGGMTRAPRRSPTRCNERNSGKKLFPKASIDIENNSANFQRSTDPGHCSLPFC